MRQSVNIVAVSAASDSKWPRVSYERREQWLKEFGWKSEPSMQLDLKLSQKVSVVDRGRGRPPQFKEAVFEKFKQVEDADERKKGGTGLGLAICKAIVEGHKGTIGVESEEGKGSTFWFRLPRGKTP